MKRLACVAGQFYPADTEELSSTIDAFLQETTGVSKEEAIAIIAPHAGYIYSGAVAGAVYSVVKVPENVILLGPNHTGTGERVSLWTTGGWQTPLGTVEVNEKLASMLAKSTPLITADDSAHLREHSLEVQLPFLQRLNPSVKIVPITVMAATPEECITLGKKIAITIDEFTKETGQGVLIVVSSDMNHYETQEETKRKDDLALAEVYALDSRALLDVTHRESISMCGALPTAIAIEAALALGAKNAQLVEYATSGDVNNDYSQVVGYAGIVIK